MKKVIKSLFLILSFFILSLAISTNIYAEEPPVFERLSQDTLKVRGFGFHGFNFQDSSFVGNFPPSCFDSSLGDVYWYVTYTLSDSSNPNTDLQLTTAPTQGHYPTSFDYIVTFPGTYHFISNQRLIQHCSNNSELTAFMNSAYDLNLHVTIARDLGFLKVDAGNTLDIYATSADPDRVAPNDYFWDLDNNGIFEVQGDQQVFSAVGLTPGFYPITVHVSDQWDNAEDAFEVNVLEYPVILTTPEGTTTPETVTESIGFLNPEDSLVEDNIGAIQDGNPDFFHLQYTLPSPIFTNYYISDGEVTVRIKNTGVDVGIMSVQISGDRRNSEMNYCAEIAPSENFVEYTCSIHLYDYADKTQKWTDISLNFDSFDGRNESLEIDSVSLKYKTKEAFLNIPFDAGGPYTVVQGADLMTTANVGVPLNENLHVDWDFDNDGYYDEGGQGLSYTYNTDNLTPGEYTIGAKLISQGGGSRVSLTTITVDPSLTPTPTPTVVPEPVTVTFDASADTNIRSGQDNRNYGNGEFMRIQSSGHNRALVRFDQQELESAIGSGAAILSATLRLTITDNGNNWGASGRTVDIHRLLMPWDEGTGTETDRGDGSGATWKCAIDSTIENQSKNCSNETEWEMGQPNNPEVHPWVETATDSTTITNGQTGIVEYDVMADVQAFLDRTSDNYGWLLKKTNEGQNGQVSFGTRESSAIPQLVITYQP